MQSLNQRKVYNTERYSQPERAQNYTGLQAVEDLMEEKHTHKELISMETFKKMDGRKNRTATLINSSIRFEMI